MMPVKSPAYEFQWGPSPALNLQQSPARIPVDFSPPLIVMLVVAATAFVIVTYFRLISRHLLPPVLRLLRRCRLRWRLWRHRRRSFYPSSSGGDIESSPPSYDAFESASAFYHLSPYYGLDDAVIRTIPLSIYMRSSSSAEISKKGGSLGSSPPDSMIRDCAVCLLEFEDREYVRTLPACAHAFHVDCIDIWLRSHANCPLCRAGIFRPESPFIPLMASRIRPRLDHDVLLQSILPEFRSDVPAAAAIGSETPACEIGPAMDHEPSPRTFNNDFCHDDHHFNGRNLLLKRSYSFGFERNVAADRLMVTEPATASPWRYRRGSFWSKRTSPFSSLGKPRVFSFRSYRGGVKSPFFRRRGSGFFPLSESNARSSRRSKSMTSPFFMRSSAAPVMFSSSRLRCGDPEALLSPERVLNRR